MRFPIFTNPRRPCRRPPNSRPARHVRIPFHRLQIPPTNPRVQPTTPEVPMSSHVLPATLLALHVFAAAPFTPAEGILAPGAKLQTLSTEFKFTEGPASDAEGNVYFTDQPNDRIMKWTIEGKLETFMQPSGR